MVVDELDALRDRFEGCRTIAFADLSTQMILVTDSSSTLPRETLDALCAQAALMLGANGKVFLGSHQSSAAALANNSGLRVFVRAGQEPNDVLCCICEPTVDAGAFLADARASIDRISSGN